jgi:hypothetical protein
MRRKTPATSPSAADVNQARDEGIFWPGIPAQLIRQEPASRNAQLDEF